jgi:hypothetical protein
VVLPLAFGGSCFQEAKRIESCTAGVLIGPTRRVETVGIHEARKEKADVDFGSNFVLNPGRRDGAHRKRSTFALMDSYDFLHCIERCEFGLTEEHWKVAQVMQSGVMAGDGKGAAGDRDHTRDLTPLEVWAGVIRAIGYQQQFRAQVRDLHHQPIDLFGTGKFGLAILGVTSDEERGDGGRHISEHPERV